MRAENSENAEPLLLAAASFVGVTAVDDNVIDDAAAGIEVIDDVAAVAVVAVVIVVAVVAGIDDEVAFDGISAADIRVTRDGGRCDDVELVDIIGDNSLLRSRPSTNLSSSDNEGML